MGFTMLRLARVVRQEYPAQYLGSTFESFLGFREFLPC